MATETNNLTANHRQIAYVSREGRSPGVMFFGGFNSDMNGTKATALEAYCAAKGQAFVCFDYSGHGASSGQFEEGTIGDWAADAIAVLDQIAIGAQVIVGSSMGGWIGLLAAIARPDRVAAFVGIAAAPDFTQDMMWDSYGEDIREQLRREGVYYEPSDYGDDSCPITMKLIQEGREHLLLRGAIPLRCPVRLIQGQQDVDVPWQTAVKLAGRLESDDVEVLLVKRGDHRLSSPQDLVRLEQVLDLLLAGEERA